MTPFGRTVRILLSTIALAAIGLVVLVQFTDYCRLKAVTLDGRPVPDFPARYSLNPAQTIAEQPIEKVASQMLDEHGIVKVDISYALPCSLRISTNDFTPDCVVVDKSSGYIYGLDGDGRVIPIKDSSQIWNLPLLTGLRMYRLYSFCDDIRAQLLVPRLHALRNENPNEYAMIEEIDFNDSTALDVSVAGVPYPVRASADDFAEEMHQFFAFLTTYSPDMSAATTVDLRFAPMIVRVGQPPDSTDEKKSSKSADAAPRMPRSESDLPGEIAAPSEAATPAPVVQPIGNKATKNSSSVAKTPAKSTVTKSPAKKKANVSSKPSPAKKSTDVKKSGTTKKSGGRG